MPLDDDTLAGESGASRPGRSSTDLGLGRGDVVGRYVLLERVGSGGMGVVYAAYDAELDRKVAIKLLHADVIGGEDARARQRLLREAQAMAKLIHPNVIAVHEMGEHDGRVFIAMDFVDGVTLKQWLAALPPWRSVLDVLCAAGRGLAAAHKQGLVHRDFKPDNVMLAVVGDVPERVCVTDFGLARAVVEGASPSGGDAAGSSSALALTITRDTQLLGTPAYMAPEQHAGKPLDHRADQFAFCVTLYEALYGHRPFGEDSLAELTLSITSGRIRDAPAGAKVPSWLRRAIVRGLAPRPADRYASMDELLAALAQEPARKRGAVIGALAIAVVVLGAVGAWWIDRTRSIGACEAPDGRIAMAWNDDRRAQVRATLESLDVPYALDTLERLEPKIDEYAARWAELHTRICLDRDVEGTRSDLAADLADECLGDRAQELATFVDTIIAGTGDIASGAMVSVMRLRALDQCADDAWNLGASRPPDNPETRAAVKRARATIMRSDAALSIGDYERAGELADAALAEAEASQWLPVIAAARALAGSVADYRGDHELAVKLLREAYLEAVEAGTDQHAAMYATDLCFVMGVRQARFDEGMLWGEVAERLVKRLALEGDLLEVKTLECMGSIHQTRGDYREALAVFERMLALAEKAVGASAPSASVALNNIGTAHEQLGNLDLAQKAYERALELRMATYGPRHPAVALTLNNLANVKTQREQFDEALVDYERALEITEAAYGPTHPQVAAALNNIALVHLIRGDYDQALTVGERALHKWEAAVGPNHPSVAASLQVLGNAHIDRGTLAQAIPYFERALQILEDTGAHAELVEEARLGLRRARGEPVPEVPG